MGSSQPVGPKIPWLRATSFMARTLSSLICAVIGPVLPAMSFVPAMMCTTRGLSATTSLIIRSTICELVWPPMPRSMRPRVTKPGRLSNQPSVIESPMKTTSTGVVFGVRADHPEIAPEPAVEPRVPIGAGRNLLLCPRRSRREQQRPGQRDAKQVAAVESQRRFSSEQISGRRAPSTVTPFASVRTCCCCCEVKRGQGGRPPPFGSPARMKLIQ